jgi:hypothetical protein
MALIQQSPWMDAANFGQGIGSALGQALIQMPAVKAQVAQTIAGTQMEKARFGLSQQQLQLQQQEAADLRRYRTQQMDLERRKQQTSDEYTRKQIEFQQFQLDKEKSIQDAARQFADTYNPPVPFGGGVPTAPPPVNFEGVPMVPRTPRDTGGGLGAALQGAAPPGVGAGMQGAPPTQSREAALAQLLARSGNFAALEQHERTKLSPIPWGSPGFYDVSTGKATFPPELKDAGLMRGGSLGSVLRGLGSFTPEEQTAAGLLLQRLGFSPEQVDQVMASGQLGGVGAGVGAGAAQPGARPGAAQPTIQEPPGGWQAEPSVGEVRNGYRFDGPPGTGRDRTHWTYIGVEGRGSNF